MAALTLTKEALMQFSLFKEFSQEHLERMIPWFNPTVYNKGEVIISKGSTNRDMMFILSGGVHVVDYTEHNEEVVFSILGAGEYFGEIAMIDGEPRSAYVIARERSIIAILPYQLAEQLILTTPSAARAVMKRLTGMIRNYNNQRKLLGIQNSRQRVFTFLLSLATPENTSDNGIGKPPPPPAQQTHLTIEKLPKQHDLAKIVNTSRETVSRAISQLVKLKIAQKSGNNRLIIVDSKKLIEMAAKKEDE